MSVDIERVVKNAINGGRDPHAETAKVLGVDRARAKVINYAVLYGVKGKDPLADSHFERNRQVTLHTDIDWDDGVITQTVDIAGSIHRRVLHTQEEQTKRALIALGWTPPPGDTSGGPG